MTATLLLILVLVGTVILGLMDQVKTFQICQSLFAKATILVLRVRRVEGKLS